jgi:hypothetical protein
VIKLRDILKKEFGWTDQNILIYHSEANKEKERLDRCEEVWGDPEVCCVLTNSCITVGVDFNLPDVFH